MATIQEKGRALNINNFGLLSANIAGFGADYQPADPRLTPAAVASQYVTAKAELTHYNSIVAPFKTATNDRELAFKPVSKLISRTLAALRSAPILKDARIAILKDVTTLVKKYRGIRANGDGVDLLLPPLPGGPAIDPADKNSVAHRSYVQRANTLQELVMLYANVPQYKPNEPELSVVGLTVLHQMVVAANEDAGEALVAVQLSRIALKTILDADDTGLVDVALAVKQAVASAFSFNTPQHKQISGLSFLRERD